MSDTITLPDMGDGIASGTIVAQHVKIGDVINEGDTIVEVETDKAVLPVPAPQSFVATKVLCNDGDEVKVGDSLFEISSAAKNSSTPKQTNNSLNTPITKKLEESSSSTTNKNVSNIILSELGDGITNGTVVSINANIGESISKEDTLFEIETDKAVLPYPSPSTGTIVSLHVKEGDVVKPGDNIGEISSSATAINDDAPPTKKNVPSPTNTAPSTTPKPPVIANNNSTSSTPILNSSKSTNTIPAGPAARKLSRELGINLANVAGTKRGGRIDIFDVKAYVKNILSTTTSGGANTLSANMPVLPNFNDFGNTEVEKLSNLRLTIAKHMEVSARIPHVHQTINVNISNITNWQQNNAAAFKSQGGSLSVTLFIIKALVTCLRRFPRFNASLDMSSGNLILKKYFNIGIAVDTEAGLIVPVLKNVDRMNIFEIGLALKEIAKKARERKVLPIDLKGASTTVSNLGGIGADTFTPIINWPEVAILGVSRTIMQPKVVNGELVEVPTLPLVLGYDHRVIDGADAGRFAVALKNLLEKPENLLMGLPA